MPDDKKVKHAVHLSDADFDQTVAKSPMPVFVDFYADWCGPCQLAAPVIDKLADEYDGKVMIAKLNVDENQETAQKHGVMSIPTVLIFKAGEEFKRQIGFPGEAGYKKMLDAALIAE